MNIIGYIGFLISCIISGAVSGVIGDNVIDNKNNFVSAIVYFMIIVIAWIIIVGLYCLIAKWLMNWSINDFIDLINNIL